MSTILVVDDDFDVRDCLTDILEDEGLQVATACDGAQALEYLHTHPAPNLILLDWMMPRCDGAQFCEEQQRDPTLAAIPIVLLTADPRVEDQVAAIGAADLLLKPLALDRLLEVVQKYAGAR